MRSLLFLLFLMLCLTAATCEKEEPLCTLEGVTEKPWGILNPWDTISYVATTRNDVPPPPEKPWRSVDATDFDECQSKLWNYLQHTYPTLEENYWEYNIYAFDNEPEDHWEHLNWNQELVFFFADTMTQLMLYQQTENCSKVDTSFFLNAIGSPTCIVSNQELGEVNYSYFFKLNKRHGPCPYIFTTEAPQGNPCKMDYFNHCGIIQASFSDKTGLLTHILYGARP